jgi:outer membrane biosynthesis protein TonB
MEEKQVHFGSFPTGHDRRLHSRKSPSSVIYVELDENSGGVVLDLGEGGLAMTSAAPLVGEYYPRMRFKLPNCSHWIETSGRIIWLTDSKKRVGIQFVDLAEGARNQIKDWVSSEQSSVEIQDSLRSILRKGKQLEMPSPRKSRVMVPKRAMANGADEMRFDDLFPSESAPARPPEVQPPTAIAAQAPISYDYRNAGDSILGLGWGTHTDRTDPTTEPRSWFRPTAFVGFVAVICFAIGVAIGNGSFYGLLSNMEKLISGRGESVSEIAAPQANSLAGPLNSSAEDAPQQTAETTTEPSRTSSGPTPDGLPTESEGQPAATSAPAAPGGTGAAEKNWTQMGESQGTILVTAPSEGSQPLVMTLPERAVSASSSFAISSQRSIIVPPEPGSEAIHRPKRLRVGGLIFHVEPQYPRVEGQEGFENTIRLRATVGEDGRISDVRAISGPPALFPPAITAVREWSYRPTFLNGQPIKTQEDIIIVFRGS